MRSISIDAMRSLYAENTGDVFVFAVSVNHPSWVEPLHLVADTQELVFDGITYKPFTFSVPLLPQTDSTVPTVALKIDAVTQEFIEGLRSVTSALSVGLSVFRRPPIEVLVTEDGKPITSENDLQLILSPDTTTREIGVMPLSGAGFTATATSITINLTMNVDYLNEPATKDRFNPSTAPDLF